ncbi:MAG: homoserine kinase [Anaerolineae bacterium]|nr:homoserine kinase [Anaerolineae bacterium]
MSTPTPAHSRTVTVSVPATSANLGPGFDCLGLALELRNEVTVTAGGPLLPYDDPRPTDYAVAVSGIDADKVPADSRNLLVQAADTLFQRAGRRPAALTVNADNQIPVGSGLGSSSAAIIAGLLAANAVSEAGWTQRRLLRLAVAMEGHPDNVAPALLGGLVLGVLPDATYGPAELILRRMPPPRPAVVVVLPDFPFLTADARAALPPAVPRADAIFNASRVALLLHALTSDDPDCLRVAMGDRLHQPYRLPLIPGAPAAYEAAYAAGALGVALSGAGPSLLAFVADNGVAGDGAAVGRAMSDAFAAAGLASRTWLLRPSAAGARLTATE